MNATITPLEQHARNQLKDFLIFRVDENDGHHELSDDSDLEGEAIRYADLMSDAKRERGVHYEVYAAGAAEPLYSTGQTNELTEMTCIQTDTW